MRVILFLATGGMLLALQVGCGTHSATEGRSAAGAARVGQTTPDAAIKAEPTPDPGGDASLSKDEAKFRADMAARLDQVEEELKGLRERAQAARGPAKKQAEKAWHEIVYETREARQRLDKLARAGRRDYEKNKHAIARGLDDLEGKLKKLRAEVP